MAPVRKPNPHRTYAKIVTSPITRNNNVSIPLRANQTMFPLRTSNDPAVNDAAAVTPGAKPKGMATVRTIMSTR